jgi:ferredoxin
VKTGEIFTFKNQIYYEGFIMISIDESRCNLCGLCVPVCVRRILTKGEKSIKITDRSLCLACGHCKAACPTDAPQLPGMNEQFLPAPSEKEIPGAADLFRFLRRRRSLRVYRPDPVEKEKLKMLIEAGRYAPTGSNRQACEYAIVRGRKILDQVCALATQSLQEEGIKIQKMVDQYRQAKKPLPEDLDSRGLGTDCKKMERRRGPASASRPGPGTDSHKGKFSHHGGARCRHCRLAYGSYGGSSRLGNLFHRLFGADPAGFERPSSLAENPGGKPGLCRSYRGVSGRHLSAPNGPQARQNKMDRGGLGVGAAADDSLAVMFPISVFLKRKGVHG